MRLPRVPWPAAWVGLLLLLLVLPAGVAADAFQSRQGIRLFDAVVSLPQPIWQGRGGDGPGSGHRYEQRGPMALVVWYPRGARAEQWSRLYGLSGTRFPTGRTMSLDEATAAVVLNYADICTPSGLLSETIAADGRSRTFVVYCGTTRSAAAASGYGPDVGEIDLVRVFSVAGTMVSVSHRWRGGRFLREDATTWPMPQEELQTMIERFAQIRVEAAP